MFQKSIISLVSLVLLIGQVGAVVPTTFDTADRAAVRNSYNGEYAASKRGIVGLLPISDIENCIVPSTPVAYREAIVFGINWFRILSGWKADKTAVEASQPFSVGDAPLTQRMLDEASLIMVANRVLTHHPDPSLRCYSDAGRLAANTSNIGGIGNYIEGVGLGLNGNGVEGFFVEGGVSNRSTGHRATLLDTWSSGILVGTSVSPNGRSAQAVQAVSTSFSPIFVIDDSKKAEISGEYDSSRDGMLAYPGRGYFPNILAGESWSIHYPFSDFSQATVKAWKNGIPVPVRIFGAFDTERQSSRLTFVPEWDYLTLFSYCDDVSRRTSNGSCAQPDVVYKIEIANVSHRGQRRTWTYSTVLFDPEVSESSVNRGGQLMEDDRLFNWAEATYPTLFPVGSKTTTVAGYLARCYATGNCIGTRTDGNAYVYMNGQVLPVGKTEDWVRQAISAGF